MKIGTDVSLKTCAEEGYTVIDFKVKELFPNGRKNGMDKTASVNVYQCIPEHLRADFATEENPFGTGKILDVCIDFESLVELFNQHQGMVKKFADLDSCPIEMDDPTEHDFLSLADMMNSYCGLE